jgi:23S rRNA (cytidine1920-2'-O)/16S rRNA (cytidine1409-2'-O)-methyltransferase
VWAIDVGHNQLVWRLRQDARVVVLEGVNARNLDPAQFPVRFDLATIDVSFISLTKILPAVRPCLTDPADCVALIKPQFEVGKGEVGRGGIVTDPAKHRRVLNQIKDAATAIGFRPVGLIESPILGAEGNREFLMHLKPACENGADVALVDEQIDSLIR